MAERKARRPQGVTLLAIYRFFVGAVALLVAGLVILLALPILFTASDAAGAAVAIAFLGMAGMLVFVYAAASLVVGWGLLKMQPWSRWGALVLAVFSLLDFPAGTAVAVATIWYLTQQSLAEQFRGNRDEPAASAE